MLGKALDSIGKALASAASLRCAMHPAKTSTVHTIIAVLPTRALGSFTIVIIDVKIIINLNEHEGK